MKRSTTRGFPGQENSLPADRRWHIRRRHGTRHLLRRSLCCPHSGSPDSGDCSRDGRFDYNDGLYRGKYDQYSNCGGTGGYDAYVLSAVDINDPTAMIIVIMVQTLPGDLDTVNQIMASFYVYF